MSARTAQWILWTVLLVLLPVPYWAVESGREPVANIGVFAMATGVAAIAEPSGIAQFIAAVFVAQTLLWAFVLYLTAGWLARRSAMPRRRVLVVAGITAAALALAFLPIYVTPFSPESTVGSLLP